MPKTARLTEPDARVLESSEVNTRLAENKDGKKIKELVTSAGFNIDIPFDDIYPFWLVAEYENEIVGCIQTCIGKPIGRVEMLAAKKSLPHRICAIVVLQLLVTAINTLKQSGAVMASGVIPFTMKSYKRILRRYGCVTFATGNLMAKKL